MSGKSKKDYKKVFQAILDLLPVDPEVKSFVVDYGSGLWRALKSLFDNPDIKGCAFHWGQAVWRKVQEKGLQKAVGDQLQSVMQYINDTWMHSTVWPISSWSVFGRSVRTNNDTEGWHHHLNRKAKKGNLPFYVLLKLLAKQALAVPFQVKLVSEGKLRRTQRKKTRETQGKLFALWKQYADNSLSVSRLLKKCGPTV